jgi:positive regulator of sigma E activity
LEEGALVGASVTVYLIPLLGMILLPILAKFLNFSEFFQIVGAILGFIVGVFIGRYMGLRGVASGQYQPRLLR